MLIAEMPDLGQITGEQAASLTGLALVAHGSGTLRGKRAIGVGRRLLRHVKFPAALAAAHQNLLLYHLKTVSERPENHARSSSKQ
jgi:transposase